MASFDDYLREGRLLDDYNKATILEKQEVYNNWLKVKNPQPTPGNMTLHASPDAYCYIIEDMLNLLVVP